MLVFVTVLVGVLGLAIGSFLNVVVYRVPAGLSIVSPPSACPSCHAPIRKRDNIPIVSWLLLRGKCRDCGARISARYPLVELGTAVLFSAIALVRAPSIIDSTTALEAISGVVALIAFLYLAAASVALVIIDLETQRLPNVIVLPSFVVAAVLLTTASLLAGDVAPLGLAAIGVVASLGFYFLLAFGYRGGMGMGDVKLAGVLGLYLGWLGLGALLVGSFLPFLLGGLFAVVLIIARRAGRKSRIPFGPWMILGAWAAIFAGDAIFEVYLRVVGLA